MYIYILSIAQLVEQRTVDVDSRYPRVSGSNPDGEIFNNFVNILYKIIDI